MVSDSWMRRRIRSWSSAGRLSNVHLPLQPTRRCERGSSSLNSSFLFWIHFAFLQRFVFQTTHTQTQPVLSITHEPLKRDAQIKFLDVRPTKVGDEEDLQKLANVRLLVQ